MVSLNIIVPLGVNFNLVEIAPEATVVSKVLYRNLGKFYVIEVDEEAASVIVLLLGKEHVWKR